MKPWRGTFLLVALLGVGCGARFIRFQEKGMTCTQAQSLATRAVHKMGYAIDETVKPLPGFPGIIRASMPAPPGSDKQKMFVQVFCTSMGAEIEARSEDGGLQQLGFASDFRRAFDKVVAAQPPARVAVAQGLDVIVTPQSGKGSAELSVDLSKHGLFPVQVRISNHTTRTYELKTKNVMLQTTGGEKVRSTSLEEVVRDLDPEAAAQVRGKLLAGGVIAPEAAVDGLLFFPFKPYVRARITLTDVADGEPEGFSIDF